MRREVKPTELVFENLVLQPLVPEHTALIFQLRSDPQVNQFLDRAPAQNLEDATVFIEKVMAGVASGNSYYWCIVEKNEGVAVGTVCL